MARTGTAARRAMQLQHSQPDQARVAPPELDTEVANRLRDPFEVTYLGVLRTNDPLLLEKGRADMAIYRDLKRDGTVFSGLQKRTLALVGYDWMVEAVDKNARDDSELMTEILKSCNFDQVCKEFMEALLIGMAVGEVVWTYRDGYILPERIVKRKPTRFVFVQIDPNRPPELRLLTTSNMVTGEPLPERKFIVHRVNAEDDNPYGTGLGLQSYWPVFFKRKGIIAWNKLNDRFGAPTPMGKYPRNAGPKEKNTLFGALRAMSNDGVLMIPEGMSVELLESKLSGGVSSQKELCEYMDDWISAVWLGQEPRASGGGALAAASKERSDVRLGLTKGDSDLLSGTLNCTLLAWICELNGLNPCQVYRQIKEEVDVKAMADADAVVAGMGFEMDESTVQGKYGAGWTKKPAPAPAAGPGALPGAPMSPADFAEAALAPAAPTSPTAADTARLVTASAPAWSVVVDHLQEMVNQAASMEQLQGALTQAYGNLDSDDLVKLMAAAFALTELKGLGAVQAESQTHA